MSRSGRVWDEAEARYPMLQQFFGCYLHEDWPEESGTPQAAVNAAIAGYPLEMRRQARRELEALLRSTDDDSTLRRVLNDGLGVNVYFRESGEARAFAEEAERKLLDSIQGEFERRRKEGTA
jgi:hypothetical protein